MDEQGRKMSKSLGNAVAPQNVIKQNGAEILRLWVASSDYSEDLRIGPEIIKANVESYRKIRNTLKYLLGNLGGFDQSEKVDIADMPELERWVLHRLWELDGVIRKSYDDFDFRRIFTHLFNFCTLDLSALYFDIRKDSLYCDRKDNLVRRASRTVLDQLYHCLTAWFAPILCFTAEEAWQTRFGHEAGSVHLRQFPEIPAEWKDAALAEKWSRVWQLRSAVTGALEIERREKRIGSSLEAAPVIYVQDGAYIDALDGLDLAEIVITSQATLIEGPAPGGAFQLDGVDAVAVMPKLAEGKKCQRCWKILPDVAGEGPYVDLEPRCADAVAFMEQSA
jgi:isoleucyl-tRNA synthetase